jgi:Right handed beta helix region
VTARHLAARLIAVLGMICSFALPPGAAQATTVHCGDTITHDTTLDNDVLGCTGDYALRVVGHDLTLNLNGHTVEGHIGNSNGQNDPPADNNVIENGVIRGTVGAGSSDNVVIKNNLVIAGPNDYAISFGKASGQAINNLVRGGLVGIGMDRAAATISANTITGTSFDAISVDHSVAAITDNSATGNEGNGLSLSYAFGLRGLEGTLDITHNIFDNNGGTGIAMDSTNGSFQISENHASENGKDGMFLGYGNGTASNNQADRNAADGIHASEQGTTLSGNHAWFNGNLGIEAVPGTLGSGNWAKHNGNSLQCVPGSLCSTTGRPRG